MDGGNVVSRGAQAAGYGSDTGHVVGHWRLPKAAAFWSLALLLLMLVFGSAAASPLYRVYQAQLGFSATTLTGIFAVYVLALLVALLFFGSVSDYLGRVPVIIVSIGFSAAGCAAFLTADTVAALFVARFLQGISAGLASSAISAALFDLQPAGSQRASLVTSAFSTLGLALGALISSALMQYAPAPTHLIWWALLVVFVASVVTVLAIEEPGTRHPGVLASMRPTISVPRQARATFAGAIPCMASIWALGGLYLSLGPSLAALATGSPNPVWGGLVIFLLFGTGAGATFAFRTMPPRSAMLRGSGFLLAGLSLTFFAITTTTAAAFLVGTAVAGVGLGLAFSGAFRLTTAQAAPGQGAGLVSAIFVVNYIAFSVPALLAGVATTRIGLQSTALAYAAVLAVLIVAALGVLLLRGDKQPRTTRTSQIVMPPAPCTAHPCQRAMDAA